jgi:hypothetical protein
MLNIAEIAAQAAVNVAREFIQDAGIVSSRDKDIKTAYACPKKIAQVLCKDPKIPFNK